MIEVNCLCCGSDRNSPMHRGNADVRRCWDCDHAWNWLDMPETE